jgi:hypothetical protein
LQDTGSEAIPFKLKLLGSGFIDRATTEETTKHVKLIRECSHAAKNQKLKKCHDAMEPRMVIS